MSQLKPFTLSKPIYVLAYSREQMEVFARSNRIPLHLLRRIIHMSQANGLSPVENTLVLLPDWHRQGFQFVGMRERWQIRKGKILYVTEAQVLGKVPLDITPLM